MPGVFNLLLGRHPGPRGPPGMGGEGEAAAAFGAAGGPGPRTQLTLYRERLRWAAEGVAADAAAAIAAASTRRVAWSRIDEPEPDLDDDEAGDKGDDDGVEVD